MERCMDSILAQSYSNIEVILVNDGSPDDCGEMAEAYQEKDARVRVIHKENGGLSDARNVGVEMVTGIFTMFVDSDDWIYPTMIEKMVHYSQDYEADIVQSAFFYAYDDELFIDNRYVTDESNPICLDNRALMYELVRNKIVKNFAWGKLYKTALIKDIPFEKGVLFEDVFWAHQVMHQVKKYVIIHQPFYYYLQRDDSIVATYSPKNLDMLKGLQERHQFIEEFYEELTEESYQLILETCLIHYYLLMRHKRKDKKGRYRKEIELYIENHYADLRNAVKKNKELKNQLYLFQINPYLLLFLKGSRHLLKKIRVII